MSKHKKYVIASDLEILAVVIKKYIYKHTKPYYITIQ